jgi:hypothetical protein
LRLVSQLRTEREPRKEITMALLVVSVATKPVTSDFMELFRVSVMSVGVGVVKSVEPYFSNSVSVVVFAASTRSQFP